MTALTFCVEGDPVPWERCDSRRGQRFTAPRTRAWQGKVRLAAVAAGAKPLDGPVRVRLAFWRATARRCDWDNLAKSIADALNGVCFRDDAQIAEAHITKGVDRARPRVEVRVEAMEEEAPSASPAAIPASPAASIAAASRATQRRITTGRNSMRPAVRRFKP